MLGLAAQGAQLRGDQVATEMELLRTLQGNYYAWRALTTVRRMAVELMRRSLAHYFYEWPRIRFKSFMDGGLIPAGQA
jgi:hypothetical protein